MTEIPVDDLTAAIRAYVPLAKAEQPKRWRQSAEPSEWVLVFDTETTTDPSQRLRFGSFQWRHRGRLDRRGLFYDPAALNKTEVQTLQRFARTHGLELMHAATFIETIFYRLAYELRATIVGFNLPWDLSRLAIDHSPARRRPVQGGYSLQLSPNGRWPRVQVKHLDRKAAMIRFAAPPRERTPRGMRKRDRVPVRRGFFVDVKTLGAALTSRSDTLASLAEFLRVPSRKMATEEHGKRLTPDYIEYAVNDTKVTWECFADLSRRYAEHQLAQTPSYRISSEAGIGKAYLAEMGIQPWRLTQPDFPPEIIDIIMQTYFGGRSEVHLRRIVSQIVYADFLSMYASVCCLMGLWRGIISTGISYRETTDDTQALLEQITLDELKKKKTWRNLSTLVQVQPSDDIFPLRTEYDGDQQYTIGLNYVTSDRPIWYTLADCIKSKILSGKAPKILRALTFEFCPVQRGLKPVEIAGNSALKIDPRNDDFFKRLIEYRSDIKRQLKTCGHAQRDALDSQQQALKIIASSTSYGISVELNVEQLPTPQSAWFFKENGNSFAKPIGQFERPGRYFHPLLATLITGAARLMLGSAEKLALDAGLDWAFCDTDSMAFAKPNGMSDAQFYRRVRGIQNWFEALNPYDGAGAILKLEDANFALRNGKPTGDLAPLFVYAISSKRYVLFNLDEAGEIVIRKASAHGLGHLVPPYREDEAPASIPAPAIPLKDIGVERWQYDVWYRFIKAALDGHPDQPQIADLPNFDKPAASRYAATTPALLVWFDRYNKGKDYAARVRPFGFLLAFQLKGALGVDWDTIEEPAKARNRPRKQTDLPRPIAPFDRAPIRAAEHCFDRLTGEPISVERLKTYAEALAQYHLHPEAKFRDADYLDHGSTLRRHVHVIGVRRIGKEANRWEEQFYLGYDPETQVEYGMNEDSAASIRARIRDAARVYGQRRLAEAAGVSRERLRLFIAGKAKLRTETVARLLRAGASRINDQLRSTVGF